jgi:hypothetical protein
MWGSLGHPVMLTDIMDKVRTDALAFYQANIDALVKYTGNNLVGHLKVIRDV